MNKNVLSGKKLKNVLAGREVYYALKSSWCKKTQLWVIYKLFVKRINAVNSRVRIRVKIKSKFGLG